MPVHPPARSFTDTLAEDAEKSLLADRLGFEEVWMGSTFSATSDAHPFATDVLRRPHLTHQKPAFLGPGVINLPNHDPVIVAAEAAQFDHMSRGRFLLGVGPGGLLSDFDCSGTPTSTVRQPQVIPKAVSNHAADLVAGSALRYSPASSGMSRLTNNVIADLRHRLHAEARTRKAVRRFHYRLLVRFASARTAALQDWGHYSANIIPTYAVASHLVDLRQSARGNRQTGQR